MPEAWFDSETGETRLVGDVVPLAKVSMGAVVAWSDATRILYDYHGWDVPELRTLVDAAEALNPTDAELPPCR